MIFRLACGDVMPGCAASFENTDKSLLLEEVARHAAADHGIAEITPEMLAAVDGKIVQAPA
ncbi:DUF1059 domain-containing protein [Nocardioides aurantiacus]|uniref:Putative small metal-binding protein n=1 Tax=Nocardioides aurantiacus TaxID=86796 RepID=A0A3N2CVJ7_9ACTN|nr:DUF1059 domain-containing protein [Nocardioides aurantiacus]ROR91493.1 putative small metal-binding protein [Nocardioides aurantiacus]